MSFDYRVVKHPLNGSYGVHEVYYIGSGDAYAVGDTASIIGNDPDDLKREIEHVTLALTKPVLDYDTRKEIEPAIK